MKQIEIWNDIPNDATVFGEIINYEENVRNFQDRRVKNNRFLVGIYYQGVEFRKFLYTKESEIVDDNIGKFAIGKTFTIAKSKFDELLEKCK